MVSGASPRSGSLSQHSKVSLPSRLPEVDEPTSHHQIRNRLPGEKLQSNMKYEGYSATLKQLGMHSLKEKRNILCLKFVKKSLKTLTFCKICNPIYAKNAEQI